MQMKDVLNLNPEAYDAQVPQTKQLLLQELVQPLHQMLRRMLKLGMAPSWSSPLTTPISAVSGELLVTASLESMNHPASVQQLHGYS